MPQNLAPGAYVVEIGGAVKPVKSAPTGFRDESIRSLIEYLKTGLQTHPEDWTNLNADDPGITLLEALAYAVEDLGNRHGPIPERGLTAVARVVEAGLAVLANAPPGTRSTIKRVRRSGDKE